MTTKLTSAFSKKVLPVVQHGTIDLLRVADLQRRRAFPRADRDLVNSICDLTHDLGIALTNLNSDYEVKNPVNQGALNKIAKCLRWLSADARALGANEVILPLPYRAPWSKIMRDLVKRDNVDIKFSSRSKPYDLDLSAYGQINQSLKFNPLYKDPKSTFSLRALWHIDDECKYRWDREVKVDRRTPSAGLQLV